MTRAPGTFARTVLGLDALARTPILTRVNFVMTASNHHELRSLQCPCPVLAGALPVHAGGAPRESGVFDVEHPKF